MSAQSANFELSFMVAELEAKIEALQTEVARREQALQGLYFEKVQLRTANFELSFTVAELQAKFARLAAHLTQRRAKPTKSSKPSASAACEAASTKAAHWRISFESVAPSWAELFPGVARLLGEALAGGPFVGSVTDQVDGRTQMCATVVPTGETLRTWTSRSSGTTASATRPRDTAEANAQKQRCDGPVEGPVGSATPEQNGSGPNFTFDKLFARDVQSATPEQNGSGPNGPSGGVGEDWPEQVSGPSGGVGDD
jgi:uncharacterized small protein (DUF1192 family)